MSRTKDLGDRGEAYVAQALRKRGCRLLAHQYRCRFGEIDLIAQTRDDVLCFVEVKLRGPDALSLPREAVDRRKRERIRQTASCYLMTHDGLDDLNVRFDVAEVYLDGSGRLLHMEYLEDAFI